ncbi:vesicle transport protein USE1 isoform X1 [Hetaerina americana]|uniref:vesicle transport protein USE1 isoform X1 n=2 Tax=Hetaerina americana TaxID=62018 RepID=UPI003A7F2784
MEISRKEINFKRLLNQCEKLVLENPKMDWRLEKYISALVPMVAELQSIPNKPKKDAMSEYIRRVQYLRGLLETTKLASPSEKVAAVQLLSHAPAATSETITKEIHQKSTSQFVQELRDQLFQTDKGSDDGLRQRKQQSTDGDLDALIKYHHSMQEKIADDMILLTRNLKEQSMIANAIIKKDVNTIEKSSDLAEQSMTQLKIESERLEMHRKKASKCWVFVIVLAVIIIFVWTVLFMKAFKKKV